MLMTAVLSTYVALGRNFTRSLGISSATQPSLDTQARRTLAYFAQDVRMASSIFGNPSASTVSLILPTDDSTITVAYAYDSTHQGLFRGPLWNSATSYAVGDTAVYSGTAYRCILVHSNHVPPNTSYWAGAVPLQSNLLTCTFNYYDSSGNAYASSDLSAGNYLQGIKQLSLSFSSQAGSSANGTRTQVYQTDSPRLLLRNRSLLP